MRPGPSCGRSWARFDRLWAGWLVGPTSRILVVMAEGDVIQRYGLPPKSSDLPEIREHLAEQARLEMDGVGDTLVLKEFAVLLFAAGLVEDSLLIWRAKQASFDAANSLEVQLLCGAGYDATVEFLRAHDADALKYVLHGQDTGDFERLATALADYRRYYGV